MKEEWLAGEAGRTREEMKSLQRMTTLVYLLQAGSFVVGLSLIAAVIVNYLKRGEVRGTWLESHFRWQIRTFWFALLWMVLGALTWMATIGYFIFLGTAIWLIYRIARGWILLSEGRPLPG